MVVMPAWMRIIISAALCFGAGGVAALYIPASTPGWYAGLSRPEIFAVPLPLLFFCFVVIFALLTLASSLMWIHDPRPWDFRGWVPLFFTHLLLLMAWIILFFGYHDIFLSVIFAVALGVFVLLLVVGTWDRSRLAFGLMLPYFAFVVYAAAMCTAVWVS